MKRFQSYAPGAGFLLFVLCIAGTVALAAWALREPPLDHVLTLMLRLTSGDNQRLTSEELTLLQKTLSRHPGIASELLGGRVEGLIGDDGTGLVDSAAAYVLRTSASRGAALVIELRPEDRDALTAPVIVTVRTTETSASGVVGAQPFVWRLPDSGGVPQLIEIRRARAPVAADGARPAAAGREGSPLPPLTVRIDSVAEGSAP